VPSRFADPGSEGELCAGISVSLVVFSDQTGSNDVSGL
jgi:hypothetical protein